jgi:hypothetical protein
MCAPSAERGRGTKKNAVTTQQKQADREGRKKKEMRSTTRSLPEREI